MLLPDQPPRFVTGEVREHEVRPGVCLLWGQGTGGRGRSLRLQHRCDTCEERGKEGFLRKSLTLHLSSEQVPRLLRGVPVLMLPPPWERPREGTAWCQLQGGDFSPKFSKGTCEPCASPAASVMLPGSERWIISVPLCKWLPDWSQLALRISRDLNFLVKDIQVSVICYSMIMMFMKAWLNVCHWYRLESFIRL